MCGPEADLLHCHHNSITDGSSAYNNRVTLITVPALQGNPPVTLTATQSGSQHHTVWSYHRINITEQTHKCNATTEQPHHHINITEWSLHCTNSIEHIRAVPSLSEHHRTDPITVPTPLQSGHLSPYQSHRTTPYHHTVL